MGTNLGIEVLVSSAAGPVLAQNRRFREKLAQIRANS